MKYCLLVNAAPDTQAANTAYQFSQVLLTQQHQIVCVFFYQEGVLTSGQDKPSTSDLPALTALWQRLAKQHGLLLTCCRSARLRRGLADEPAEGFHDGSLVQFVMASLAADHTVQFG